MSKNHHKINLTKVCRTCLSERGHLREIFSTKLPKMIESCANIQVSIEEDLPSHVCLSCFHLIARFYSFQKKMQKSDRILRNYVKQKLIKQSILDIAMSEAEIEQQLNDRRLLDNDIILEQERSEVKLELGGPSSEESPSSPEQDIEDEDHINAVVFTDIPPPLVPLEPQKKSTCSSNIEILQTLPDDPPPLVLIPTETKCSACHEECHDVQQLKDHQLNDCKAVLKCNICRKEFRERKKLIGHLRGHMVVKDYGCKICGKRYPNPSTIRVHMRTHTGERPFKCPICGKGFVRWAGVAGHMKTHEPDKPFKCETCGKGFKIASNLERHKILHSDSLPFCCNYCGRTFSQSDNLQLHIRSNHTNERPFLCNECGKGFVSSTRLKRHMWVHSGYKPYRCQICTKAYSNSNDLKNHERSHGGTTSEDGKPYVCDICGLRFYHPCRLSKHVKTHQKMFQCTVCSKSFSTSGLLTRHVNSKRNGHCGEEDQPDNKDIEQIFLDY